MRLDPVAVEVLVEHRLGVEAEVVRALAAVSAPPDLKSLGELRADRAFEFRRLQNRGNLAPASVGFRIDRVDMAVINAGQETGPFVVQLFERRIAGQIVEQVAIEIPGEELAKENMREGRREDFGGLDAGRGMGDEIG